MKYIFLWLLLTISALSQTKFYLYNGNEFEGFIVESYNDSLKIDLGNTVRTISKSNIKDILPLKTKITTVDGQNVEIHITKDTPNSIIGSDAENNIITILKKDIIFKRTEYAFETEPYSTFGLTVFMPGVINLQYGRHISKILDFVFTLEHHFLI